MANLQTVLLLCAAATADPGSGQSCPEQSDRMKILERDSIDEVWTLFEEGDEPDFDAIGDPEDDTFADCRDALVRGLVRAVERRDDVRIPARILDEIDFDGSPALDPVLRAALTHRSTEIRRRAARAVTEASDLAWAPLVEERFVIEPDDGVRRDLMTALAAVNSRRFLDELGEIAMGPNAVSRRVALDAIEDMPSDESVAALESFALMQKEDSEDLDDVIDALGRWGDIPGSEDALHRIEASGPEKAAARVHAIFEPPDPETMTISCGMTVDSQPRRDLPLLSGNEREFEDKLLYVDPDDDGDSARCWDAPGYMWPGQIRPRVRRGTELRVEDEFLWKGQVWYAVWAGLAGDCWMPARDVDDDEMEEIDASAIEVDVLADEAHSWLATVLQSQGWLVRLDEGDRLATIAIDADAEDPGAVGTLAKLAELRDPSSIADAIKRWIDENAVAPPSSP
jgi:hypothetical protein